MQLIFTILGFHLLFTSRTGLVVIGVFGVSFACALALQGKPLTCTGMFLLGITLFAIVRLVRR